jgi:NADH-quinone oxidoreductase subunit N
MDLTEQILPLLPEALLFGAIPLLPFLSLFVKDRNAVKFGALLIFLAAIALGSIQFDRYAGSYFSGSISIGRITDISRMLILVISFLSLIAFYLNPQTKKSSVAETSVLFFGMAAGAILMTATTDLLMIYLSVETVSVLSYILVSLKSHETNSYEASAKYLIYGAVSSGIFLFGAVNVFGLTGSLNLSIASSEFFYGLPESRALLLASYAFIFSGLAYKIAVLPFHSWCPDVYEGASTPVVVFLNASKIAAFVLIARLISVLYPYGVNDDSARIFFSILGVATMTYGNIAAYRQRRVKRLLAYSSIAHTGYLFSLFSVWSQDEIPTLLYYLFAYMFMNGGAFFVVGAVTGAGGSNIERFSGLARTGRWGAFWALLICVHLLSLIGLPPFTGFIAKYYLLVSLVGSGGYLIALAVVINTVISVYYYLRIVRKMYFEKPADEPASVNADWRSGTIGAIFGIMNLIPGIAPAVLPLSYFFG